MAFAYRGGVLCAEDVSLEDVARRFGTPCYVYSRALIEENFGRFSHALAGRHALVAYSVKANSNLAVLALMARLGDLQAQQFRLVPPGAGVRSCFGFLASPLAFEVARSRTVRVEAVDLADVGALLETLEAEAATAWAHCSSKPCRPFRRMPRESIRSSWAASPPAMAVERASWTSVRRAAKT